MGNVTYTLRGRYVDLQKLSTLLDKLFPNDFAIRVHY